MSFYDDEETARQYIDMAAGYDGRSLIEALQKQLPENSRVLELGMGPGVDLQMLGQTFEVTGSDNLRYFLVHKEIEHDDSLYVLATA